MNTSCPISSTPSPVLPGRGLLASLQRLIDTTDLSPVDLADTIFAAPPGPADNHRDGAVPPLPPPGRPEHTRLLASRLI